MIILTNPINLYGKKVVTDLATRTGNSSVNDFSYGLGLRYKINEMWSTFNQDTDASLEYLFNTQDDFDADVCQPNMSDDDYDETVAAEEHEISTKYNPAVDKTNFNKYYRRLEDIAHAYLEKYVGYLIFNIRHHSDGYKAFNAKHLDQPLLMNRGDDDDEFTELADLQLLPDDDDWPLSVKQAALQNLPYVVKRLHNMSCYVGIHVLSFIRAYLKAQMINSNQRVAGSVKTLKRNAVIAEGVYQCDIEGNITKKVLVKNKNRKADKMFDWIIGVPTMYATYHQDYLDFVHYCNVLNVDLLNDDMTKYQADFVSKLIVTTVTPNSQYDRQVFNAILNNSTSIVNNEDELDPIENTMFTFLQVCETDDDLLSVIKRHGSKQSEVNLSTSMSIYNTHMILNKGVVTEDSKYTWEDGYLHYANELVMFPAKLISNPYNSNITTEMCIISELGYVIQVSNSVSVQVMPLISANYNLLNKVKDKDIDYKYVEWSRMGT